MTVKDVWTDADFESRVWHDCHLHAMAFERLAFLVSAAG
jgi:hypothetical protein